MKVSVVFSKFPNPNFDSHFIEVEDENGNSIRVGTWEEREDGNVQLTFESESEIK